MRFKQYLTEVNNLLYDDYLNNKHNSGNLVCYLMEMKVISHDTSIDIINKNLYQFNVNDITYNFVITEIEYLPGESIYNIHFGPDDGYNLNRLNKHSMVQVRKVFEKVITCMIMFINDLKPERFTFTGHDHKLYKTYKLIIARIQKEKPFNKYSIQDSGRAFTFERLT